MSDTTASLRRKISSAEDLRSIVRTMSLHEQMEELSAQRRKEWKSNRKLLER